MCDRRFKKFDDFFANFESEVNSNGLRQKDIDFIFTVSEKLLQNATDLLTALAPGDCRSNMAETLCSGMSYIRKK